MYMGMRVCVFIYIFCSYLYACMYIYTHNSVTIQRNKDYKSHWEISNKGTNRVYDKNIHQKNKQYLQQGFIF